MTTQYNFKCVLYMTKQNASSQIPSTRFTSPTERELKKRTKNHKGFTCIGQFLTIAPGGRELYRALLLLRMIFGREYYLNSASGTSSAQPTFRFKLEFILSHTL